MEHNTQASKKLALNAAREIVTLAYENKASHIGGALSVVDILSVLYSSVLSYNSSDIADENRDRLFYSKGHACTALYAVLHQVGYFSEDYLQTFTKDGSFLTSHVNSKVPGVELSTGSLGHALSVACGVALAGRKKNKNWRVFAILSDGELDEGSNWEAFLFAPHHKLNNLTVIVDYNKVQSFGNTNEVLQLEPLAEKFESFGWDTVEVNGHDHDELYNALSQSDTSSGKPRMIIAHTIKGKAVPFMEGELAWHYKSPTEEQWKQALDHLEKNKS